MQMYFNDKQLAERYGVSRPTIWRWVRRDLLPRPVQIGYGTTRWPIEEIDRFDSERQKTTAERGG